MTKNGKPIYWLLFIIYLIFLFRALMPFDAIRSYIMGASLQSISHNFKMANFMPLRHINGYMLMYFKPAIKLLGLPILWFMPMGYFIPSLTKHRSFKHTMIIGLLIILAIEILSIITPIGRFDVDEIILHGLGIVLGFMVYRTVK